tara:strand:- start:167 stop:316 length:150 start_codon:yes stop_codon:yes gene_type:complete
MTIYAVKYLANGRVMVSGEKKIKIRNKMDFKLTVHLEEAQKVSLKSIIE